VVQCKNKSGRNFPDTVLKCVEGSLVLSNPNQQCSPLECTADTPIVGEEVSFLKYFSIVEGGSKDTDQICQDEGDSGTLECNWSSETNQLQLEWRDNKKGSCKCADTPNWTDGNGNNCQNYVDEEVCEDGLEGRVFKELRQKYSFDKFSWKAFSHCKACGKCNCYDHKWTPDYSSCKYNESNELINAYQSARNACMHSETKQFVEREICDDCPSYRLFNWCPTIATQCIMVDGDTEEEKKNTCEKDMNVWDFVPCMDKITKKQGNCLVTKSEKKLKE